MKEKNSDRKKKERIELREKSMQNNQATEKQEENPMRKIKIEKLVLSAGGTADTLEKEFKLLKLISGEKPVKLQARKRIPSLGVRPGLEVGCKVTIREKIEPLLKRLLGGIDNKLKLKQIEDNHFSFGIEEYIEIPGMEYQRDIGILGLNATVIFTRKGKRVELRKIKKSRQGKKQAVSKDEIIKFMKQNYNVEME